MTTLLDKSLENLKVLINIKENQLLSSSPLRVLTIQNDFITVDNFHEIVPIYIKDHKLYGYHS